MVNILIQSCLTTWLFKLWLECLESLNYSQCFAIDGKRTNGNQLCGEVTGGTILSVNLEKVAQQIFALQVTGFLNDVTSNE